MRDNMKKITSKGFGNLSQLKESGLPLQGRLANEALQKAKESGMTAYVIAYDSGEGRQNAVVLENYLNTDEFEAFNGQVLGHVDPDGNMDFGR